MHLTLYLYCSKNLGYFAHVQKVSTRPLPQSTHTPLNSCLLSTLHCGEFRNLGLCQTTADCLTGCLYKPFVTDNFTIYQLYSHSLIHNLNSLLTKDTYVSWVLLEFSSNVAIY